MVDGANVDKKEEHMANDSRDRVGKGHWCECAVDAGSDLEASSLGLASSEPRQWCHDSRSQHTFSNC